MLAIDPGRDKCGLALVDAGGTALHRAICPTGSVSDAVRSCLEAHRPHAVVMGDGTHARVLRPVIEATLAAWSAQGGHGELRLQMVDERHTTERARHEYWVVHPPRGLLRLIPEGLRVPPEPYDDLAALVMARDFLLARGFNSPDPRSA